MQPAVQMPPRAVPLVPLSALTRPVLLDLAEGLRAQPLDFDRVLRDEGPDATAVLLLGRAVLGQPPEATQVAAVLPNISDVTYLPVLVGCCRGDRVAMLLDLFETDTLSAERDALVLFLAMSLLDGAPAPPRLLSLLRRCARKPLPPQAGIVVGMAAQGVADPDVQQVAERWVSLAALAGTDYLRDQILTSLRQPVLQSVPEHAPPRVTSGYTVRRPAARVGRNDPCPCSSGKKFKKCCEGKVDGQTSPVAGQSPAEYRTRAMAHLSPQELAQLPMPTLAGLDLPSMPTPLLVSAFDAFVQYSRWELAERALDVLARRADLDVARSGTLDEHRAAMIAEAIRRGAREVVERQYGLLVDRSPLCESDRIGLLLLRPGEETLALLEETAAAGLRNPASSTLVELAYALLDRLPALGILAARAALTADRSLDSYTVLEEVEAARDRLVLPPRDPGWQIFDSMMDQHVHDTVEREVQERQSAAEERLLQEVEQQRAKVRESSQQLAQMERRLREQEAVLQRAQAAQEGASRGTRETAEAADLSEELRRHRQKLAELKGLIAEGNEERRALREQLARMSDDLSGRQGRPAAAEHAAPVGTAAVGADTPAPEDEGGPFEEAGRARVLVPLYAKAVQDALRTVPVRVAREALLVVAALAGGDQAAWQTQKRLVATSEALSSYRVGLHHRLLFRVRDETLEVLELIHRQELDATVKRYR